MNEYRTSESKNIRSVHRANNMNYCVTIMLQQLVASNYFAKDRGNVKRELCLNVRIERYFSFFYHCLYCQKIFNRNRGHKQPLGEKRPPHRSNGTTGVPNWCDISSCPQHQVLAWSKHLMVDFS